MSEQFKVTPTACMVGSFPIIYRSTTAVVSERFKAGYSTTYVTDTERVAKHVAK